MYLKKLHLENFRNFKTIDIDFDEQLTVIVGNNGAGKTSILEGATTAIGTFFAGFDGIPTTQIRKSDARVQAYVLGVNDDVQPQFPVVIKATGSIDGKPITWERSLHGKEGQTYIKNAREMTDISKEYQARLQEGDQNLMLPLIAYYGTGRLWDYHREKKSDVFSESTRVNGYIDCMDGTASIKLMLNWFKKKTIQKYQRQEEKLGEIPELNVVYHAMETCFESVAGYANVKMQYNLSTNEIDVYYTDENGSRMRIPLNNLSDGYKGTISLIADIAYRMANLNPQLLDRVLSETEGIVLIDEVDLHLHPKWQQRIIADLRRVFPKVQFIVSTHAPAVINSVRNDNLVILDNGETTQPSGQTYGKDANAVLQGIMGTIERPLAVKNLFNEFYRAIDAGEHAEAKELIDRIEATIGNDDAELASCRVKLKLAQFRGGF